MDQSIWALPFGVLVLVPLWVIFRKAGLNPGWSLLVLLPYIGPVLALMILAFAPWGWQGDRR